MIWETGEVLLLQETLRKIGQEKKCKQPQNANAWSLRRMHKWPRYFHIPGDQALVKTKTCYWVLEIISLRVNQKVLKSAVQLFSWSHQGIPSKRDYMAISETWKHQLGQAHQSQGHAKTGRGLSTGGRKDLLLLPDGAALFLSVFSSLMLMLLSPRDMLCKFHMI